MGLVQGQGTRFSRLVSGLSKDRNMLVRYAPFWYRSVPDRSCFNIGASRCLQADGSLVSALARLRQHEQGQALIKTAADNRVLITRGQTDSEALGVYSAADNTITIDSRLDEFSGWERAAVLAHELQLAADSAAGLDVTAGDGCLQGEANAFGTLAALWPNLWGGALPMARNGVQEDLNFIVATAGGNPSVVLPQLLARYRHSCS
jgi:hypothetical protein